MKSIPYAPEESHVRGDFLETIRRAQKVCGDVFCLRFGRGEFYILCHPDMAHEVLVRQKETFTKLGADGKQTGLQAVLGQGLLTNYDRDSWFARRKILQPSFHKEKMLALENTVNQMGETMIADWQGSVNVSKAMYELTRNVMYKLIFSLDMDELGHSPLSVPLSLATASNSKIRIRNKQLDSVIYTLVAKRRKAHEQGKTYEDILDTLLKAQDAQTSEKMTDKEIRDELLTLFAAGHETTANALIWALYAVAKEPEVKKYGCSSVFKEALRRYPSIPSAPRLVLEDTFLAGYTLPKGARVLLSIYAIHHHPDYWEEPDAFRPERFNKHQPAYMPFGLGERVCIGRHLAMLIGPTILKQILERYDLYLPEGTEVNPKVAISLMPRKELYVRVSAVD